MSLVGKLIANKRIRRAARSLGSDPSADNYVKLAREHVLAGNMHEVLRVCSEGLQMHGGHAELQRLRDRAEQLQVDHRVAALTEELKGSPRPALWRELCSVLLKSGRLERATEAAEDWYRATRDAEALYYRAEVHAEHFFIDKGSEDGKKAYLLASDARRRMGTDPRPLQLQLEVASRCGAWQEARKCIAQLLEILPGDSSLEARFRSVLTMCQNAKSLEICLKDVERKGRFVDEDCEPSPATAVAVRPMLQQLSADEDVEAALFLRGGTALVQGVHGATAERTARAVRDLVVSSRTAARRMSLGRPTRVLLEGSFGSLLLSPGDQGASAVWSGHAVGRRHEELLTALSGMAGHVGDGA